MKKLKAKLKTKKTQTLGTRISPRFKTMVEKVSEQWNVSQREVVEAAIERLYDAVIR